MSQDSTVSDLEMRIAFLEDQIDALNREVVSLNRDRDKLTEELHALATLVRPLIEQMSQLGGADDAAPPPHY
jgi:SlyX protein